MRCHFQSTSPLLTSHPWVKPGLTCKELTSSPYSQLAAMCSSDWVTHGTGSAWGRKQIKPLAGWGLTSVTKFFPISWVSALLALNPCCPFRCPVFQLLTMLWVLHLALQLGIRVLVLICTSGLWPAPCFKCHTSQVPCLACGPLMTCCSLEALLCQVLASANLFLIPSAASNWWTPMPLCNYP